MNDETIQDAFAYGASEITPPADLWDRIRTELGARQATRRRPLWKTVTALVAGILLAFSIGLAASPSVRAGAAAAWSHLSRVIWSGQVGDTRAEVRWADSKNRAELEMGGIRFGIPFVTVASVAEAAAQVGYQPAALTTDGATPEQVSVAVVAALSGGGEVRMVTLDYRLGSGRYSVGSEAYYVTDGTDWKLQPRKSLDVLLISPQAPGGARVEDLGRIKAVCFEDTGEGISGSTMCQWLQDGRGVGILGPDAAKVVELARGLVR